MAETSLVEYVEVASELLEKLSEQWSVPVQIKIDRREGNCLVLRFREPPAALNTGSPTDGR